MTRLAHLVDGSYRAAVVATCGCIWATKYEGCCGFHIRMAAHLLTVQRGWGSTDTARPRTVPEGEPSPAQLRVIGVVDPEGWNRIDPDGWVDVLETGLGHLQTYQVSR